MKMSIVKIFLFILSLQVFSFFLYSNCFIFSLLEYVRFHSFFFLFVFQSLCYFLFIFYFLFLSLSLLLLLSVILLLILSLLVTSWYNLIWYDLWYNLILYVIVWYLCITMILLYALLIIMSDIVFHLIIIFLSGLLHSSHLGCL